jgi:hypothetical protein
MIREIDNFKAEIVSGGQVGIETTVRISADIKVESIGDEISRHDWAVSQAYIKYWLISDTWAILDQGKEERHTTDYSREPGSYALLDWHVEMETTWIPETVGTYYISARAIMFSNITVGDFWPPQWNYEYSVEQLYAPIDITAPSPQSLDEGSFLVTVGDNIDWYDFDGLVISEEVNQTGTIDGHEVRIFIPANTLVLGTYEIEVVLDGLVASIIPQALFNNVPELYVDGIKQ